MIDMKNLNKETKIFFIILITGVFFSIFLILNSKNDLCRFMAHYILSSLVGAMIGLSYLYRIRRLDIYKGRKYEVRDNLFSSKIAKEIRVYPLLLIIILLILIFIFISEEEFRLTFQFIFAACLGANITLGYFLSSRLLDVYKEGVIPSEEFMKEEEIIVDKTFHNLNKETKIFFIVILLLFVLAILCGKSFFAPVIMSAVVGALIGFIYFFLLDRINIFKGKKYSFLYGGWIQWKKMSWSIRVYEIICFFIGMIALFILYRAILSEEFNIWMLERTIMISSCFMFFAGGMLLTLSYFYATKRLNASHTT